MSTDVDDGDDDDDDDDDEDEFFHFRPGMPLVFATMKTIFSIGLISLERTTNCYDEAMVFRFTHHER